MVWAFLVLLGVPIWLCVAGIAVMITRNRAIRRRPGSVQVRRRPSAKKRWSRGYGVWVRDVFAYRGSPAAWKESLIGVRDVVVLIPTNGDRKKLRRLGASPSVVRFVDDDGAHVDFATPSDRALDLIGPFVGTKPANALPSSSGEV